MKDLLFDGIGMEKLAETIAFAICKSWCALPVG